MRHHAEGVCNQAFFIVGECVGIDRVGEASGVRIGCGDRGGFVGRMFAELAPAVCGDDLADGGSGQGVRQGRSVLDHEGGCSLVGGGWM